MRKQWLEIAARRKLLQHLQFLLPLKWLLQRRDQVYDHSQPVAICKATLVSQDGDRMTIRKSETAVSLLLI